MYSPTGMVEQRSLAVATTTFAGCNERGIEGLQLLPHILADGRAGHEAAKHNCIRSLQTEVVLATLNTATQRAQSNTSKRFNLRP